jgi:PAS domain S-box-containing protein
MSSNSKNPANSALRKIQKSLIKFIDSLDEGFELLELIFDRQGNVVDFVFLEVNSAYEKQTGLQAANLIGKRKKENAPAREQRWYDYAIQAVKTGTPLHYEYYNDKVNGYFETQFIPISTNQIAVLFKDVTERKKMEAALQQSRKKFQDLTETTYDFVWEMDPQGRYTYCSPQMEKLWGIKAAEMIGKTPFDMMPPGAKEKALESFITFANSPKPFSGLEIPAYDSQGNLIFIEINGVPFFDTEGKLLGFRGISRDITERKNFEKLLKEKERMAAIGETAGMVGHDLRNPLQTIVSELYLAEAELKELPEGQMKTSLQENLDSISEQIGYMDKIVSDLQTFVKPVEVHKQIVNLKELTNSTMVQVSIPNNILTTMKIEERLIAYTDPQLLKRVLINLITNSVQAMPQGGELTIRSFINEGGHAQIEVEDTGEGITEEIKPKIFTPLFTTKSKGQGFGLAVCKRVIEAQGGTIRFESQAGRGTKFIIRLPAQR